MARVAVLDAGGQYVDLVKKAIERQGYPADVLPLNTPMSRLEKKYQAIVMSGSPASSHAEDAPMPEATLWKTKLPYLGICYGQQSLARAFGGTVKTGVIREDGQVVTIVDTTHPLFKGLKPEVKGLFTHGDFVTRLPKGFRAIGSHEISKQTVYSAIAKDNFIAVQFHPEVFDDTPNGYDIIKNFLAGIAGLKPDKNFASIQAEHQLDKIKREIKAKAGKRHVIAFASGGVDSTVATLVASQVIPKSRLHIFYIDNAFMRDEDDAVIDMLQKIGVNVKKIDAIKEFEQAYITENRKKMGPLVSVTDPETKRKIIGHKFAQLKDELTAELKLPLKETMLLQGTNAADRIESGHSKGGQATDKIKTHHNQVAAIKELEKAGLLIEPIDDLFKDEIRRIGSYLGLPDEVVWRQPFPGPGLAIRMLTVQEGQFELHSDKDQKKVQKYVSTRSKTLKAQLLPIRSVGVGGDARSHISAVALQGQASWKLLATLAHDVPANFRGEINRVVYALGKNPISRLSVTQTNLGKDCRLQLKQADKIVFEEMRRLKLIKSIKQCPVVLLPLSFGAKGQRSIVLRPVNTSTFMTVQAMLPGRALPKEFIDQCVKRILTEVNGISQVFLDLTNKPPGTTEWE